MKRDWDKLEQDAEAYIDVQKDMDVFYSKMSYRIASRQRGIIIDNDGLKAKNVTFVKHLVVTLCAELEIGKDVLYSNKRHGIYVAARDVIIANARPYIHLSDTEIAKIFNRERTYCIDSARRYSDMMSISDKQYLRLDIIAAKWANHYQYLLE